MKYSQRRELKRVLSAIEDVLSDIAEDGYELRMLEHAYDLAEYHVLRDNVSRDYERTHNALLAVRKAIHLK